MNSFSKKKFQADLKKVKNGIKKFCTISFIPFFLSTSLSNSILDESKISSRTITSPLTSVQKLSFRKFQKGVELRNKNEYRYLCKSQLAFTQTMGSSGLGSTYPKPPVPAVNPPQVTNIQKYPVKVGKFEEPLYITTFTYNKTDYWTILGNALPYKYKASFEEELRKKGANTFPNSKFFNLPIAGDHVFMEPDRNAMHLGERWASVYT